MHSDFVAPGFLGVVRASYTMDMRMRFRYRANFLGGFVRSFLFILVFYLFAGAYSFRSLDLSLEQTLLFFISGFLFIVFDGVALWTPLNTVNRDLYNGTLEYLFSSPHSRIGYFVGVVLAEATMSSVLIVPILMFLVASGMVTLIPIMVIVVDLFLMATVMVAFGTMVSLSVIMWKQVGSLAGIIGTLFQFLSGFFFPISILPVQIRVLGYLLPYTWAIDLARYYTFNGEWETILPVPAMWGIMVLFAIAYWAVSQYLMRRVEEFSKIRGLHLL